MRRQVTLRGLRPGLNLRFCSMTEELAEKLLAPDSSPLESSSTGGSPTHSIALIGPAECVPLLQTFSERSFFRSL
jgi:hypothetical protein